jgi:hypothetical protein
MKSALESAVAYSSASDFEGNVNSPLLHHNGHNGHKGISKIFASFVSFVVNVLFLFTSPKSSIPQILRSLNSTIRMSI